MCVYHEMQQHRRAVTTVHAYCRAHRQINHLQQQITQLLMKLHSWYHWHFHRLTDNRWKCSSGHLQL